MKHAILTALLLATLGACATSPRKEASMRRFGIVIHGGAGTILRSEMTAELESDYRRALGEARDAGYAVLQRGGGAVDAVVAAVKVMEDSPLFNAGKGAVLNAAGDCEMDASIMDGRTRAGGGVAIVRRIKNPIDAARLVMDKTSHVLLAGTAADDLARSHGLAIVDPDYFKTERRLQQWRKARELEQRKQSTRGLHERVSDLAGDPELRVGTVGAVALDQAGNLAAATSTGGRTHKAVGRVGDSPILGAGTWADNRFCAVSGTGHGEMFIRTTAARDVAAHVEFQGMDLDQATRAVIKNIESVGGDGGLIAIDRHGNIAMNFDTPGMYRAFRLSDGTTSIAIFD
jgi:beta-aspartyl-peptidase (threonine type)